jgi:hypothetical protein
LDTLARCDDLQNRNGLSAVEMLFGLVVVVDNFNDEDDSDSLLELLETDVVIGLKEEMKRK